MTQLSNLQHFLENIMQVNVTRMAGAGAGIIGSSDADNTTVNDLKKTSIAFAHEYRKQEPNQLELKHAAEQVSGFLQILRVTNALSESKAAALIDELEDLMDKRVV